jgi:hypothetical protein
MNCNEGFDAGKPTFWLHVLALQQSLFAHACASSEGFRLERLLSGNLS